LSHELTHVLQYMATPGATANARWEIMQSRYAADEARFGGKQGAYATSAALKGTSLTNLNVLHSDFALEGIARYVGMSVKDKYLDAVMRQVR
jgi:hypothetical protein